MKSTTMLQEIRSSSEEELKGRLDRLENDIFKLRLKRATNQLEDVMQIRRLRREIARVNTVLREKRAG
jgi:large subunit ribosomal protein L29